MNIYILSNREVVNQSDSAGTNGENNAEIMYFHFPEQIVGIDMSNITKWIQFKNEELDLLQMIENDEYSLTDLITQYESVEYQILLKYNNLVLWKSNVAELDFGESLDISTTITVDDLSVLNQLKLQVEELKKQYEEAIKQGNDDIAKLIKQVEDLETKINKAENGRVQAESERNKKIDDLVKEVENTILKLAHSVEEYNLNAENELNRLSETADTGVSAVNFAKDSAISSISSVGNIAVDNIKTKETSSIKSIDDNTTDNITEFDTNAENKTNIFNTNATDKLNEFNNNYEAKKEEINSEINIDRISTLEQEVFEKEKIKSEYNTMILEDTEEGLNIAINEIKSNKLEQVTTSIANGDEYDSPSPSNPSEIGGVSGDVNLIVKNNDNTENQELTLSLGDKTLYKGDKILRKDGKWYFVTKWTVINDFTNIYLESLGSGTYRMRMPLNNKIVNSSHIYLNKSYSNILNCISDGQTYNKVEGFTISSPSPFTTPQMFVYIKEFENYTKEQYIEALNNLQAYFVVPLKEEDLEEILDSTLINQLNKLLRLKQYKEVTNIDFDQDVIFEIDVDKSEIRVLKETNTAQNIEIEKLKEDINYRDKIISGLQGGQVEGINEGDNITIYDCLELPINFDKIYGKPLKQETREGYNKFKNFSYNNESITDSGITVTLQKNGKVLINGTSTKENWFEIMYDFKLGTSMQDERIVELDNTKTYTAIVKKKGTNSKNISVGIQNVINATIGIISITPSMNGNYKSFTESDGLYRTWIYVPLEATYNNVELEIMVLER